MAKRSRGSNPREDERLSSSITLGGATHSDQIGVGLLAPFQATAATSENIPARIEAVVRNVEARLNSNRGDTIQQFPRSTTDFKAFYVQDLPYFNNLIEELCYRGVIQSFNEDFILNPVNGIYLKACTQNEMKEDIKKLNATVDALGAKFDSLKGTLEEMKTLIMSRFTHNPLSTN